MVGHSSKMSIGSRANVIRLRRDDLKCSRAKGREKVLKGIGHLRQKVGTHSQANVFITSTGGR